MVIFSAMIKAFICFKGMLARGANVNHQDDYGDTALHFACDERSESCVRALYSAGCDTNLRNREGETAVHRMNITTKEDIIKGRIVRILQGENVPLMAFDNTVMDKESASIHCVIKAGLDGCLVDFLETNRVSIDVLSKFLTQENTFTLENVIQVDHIYFHVTNC